MACWVITSREAFKARDSHGKSSRPLGRESPVNLTLLLRTPCTWSSSRPERVLGFTLLQTGSTRPGGDMAPAFSVMMFLFWRHWANWGDAVVPILVITTAEPWKRKLMKVLWVDSPRKDTCREQACYRRYYIQSGLLIPLFIRIIYGFLESNYSSEEEEPRPFIGQTGEVSVSFR